jgi:hypothetical protein
MGMEVVMIACTIWILTVCVGLVGWNVCCSLGELTAAIREGNDKHK